MWWRFSVCGTSNRRRPSKNSEKARAVRNEMMRKTRARVQDQHLAEMEQRAADAATDEEKQNADD